MTLAIVLIASVFAVEVGSATAGRAHHCGHSIKAHHATCKVAKRVVRKWRHNDYSGKNIGAGGTGWHCGFEESDYFNCFSNLSGRVSGQIKHH